MAEYLDLAKHTKYSKAGIFSKEIVKKEKSSVTLFCMAKGTEISEHTATRDGFVYVIEGKVFSL
ncbi:MAG: hypothetical protein ABIF10_01800 [Candidatus Woesearchaeota archaeon]